jgi:chromosome segregation ATPase
MFDLHTIFTVVAILIILAFFGYYLYKFTPDNAVYSPTILTTLGIFFTFLGIAIGLLGFDSNNIEKSIPSLLASLRTAFWASVFGVGGAVIIKLRHFFYMQNSSKEVSITPNDMLQELRDINNSIKGKDNSDLVKALETFTKSIGNNISTNIAEQITSFKEENKKQFDRLIEVQENALAQISEGATATLIDALRQVLEDFQTTITDHIADNFKDLAEAVNNLISWQKHYEAQIRQTTESMESAANRYTSLVEHAEIFQTTSEALYEQIQLFQSQTSNLKELLVDLNSLVKATSKEIPQIENRIINISEQISNSSNIFNENINTSIAKTANQTEILTSGIEKAIQASIESLGKNTTTLMDQLIKDHKDLNEALIKNYKAVSSK